MATKTKYPPGPYKIEGNLIYTQDGKERIAGLFDHLGTTDLFANAPGLCMFAELQVQYAFHMVNAQVQPEEKWPPDFLYIAAGFSVVIARVHRWDKTFKHLIESFQSCDKTSPFLKGHALKLIRAVGGLLVEASNPGFTEEPEEET